MRTYVRMLWPVVIRQGHPLRRDLPFLVSAYLRSDETETSSRRSIWHGGNGSKMTRTSLIFLTY